MNPVVTFCFLAELDEAIINFLKTVPRGLDQCSLDRSARHVDKNGLVLAISRF